MPYMPKGKRPVTAWYSVRLAPILILEHELPIRRERWTKTHQQQWSDLEQLSKSLGIDILTSDESAFR